MRIGLYKKVKIITLIFLFPIYYSLQWLPDVTGYDTADPYNGFSGLIGQPERIQLIKIEGGYKYRVHVNGRWLHPVTGFDPNDPLNGYAGIEGQFIDALAVEGVPYRIHIPDEPWIDEKSGFNTKDKDGGYLGVFGKPIDAFMVKTGKKYSAAIGLDNNDNRFKYNYKQIFSENGTGIEGIPTQSNIEHMEMGNLFITCCVKAGFANKQQLLDAYFWGIINNYIDAINMNFIDNEIDRDSFVIMISQYFGTDINNEIFFNTEKGEDDYLYLIDKNGKEVFNSNGLGYR